MEQMLEALKYSDDINGDIGGSIDAVYEMLYAIAQKRRMVESLFRIVGTCMKIGWLKI